jgi:hypothetical protein
MHDSATTLDWIVNEEGTTFVVGDRLRHRVDNWTGTLIAINRGNTGPAMLKVMPDRLDDLPRRDCYPLNSEHAARTGTSHFCRPRDHGMSMGNFVHLGERSPVNSDEPATPVPPREDLFGMGLKGLCTAYAKFVRATGYPALSADELLLSLYGNELTPASHIHWLGDFLDAWSQAEAEAEGPRTTKRSIWTVVVDEAGTGTTTKVFATEAAAEAEGWAFVTARWTDEMGAMPETLDDARDQLDAWGERDLMWIERHEVTL